MSKHKFRVGDHVRVTTEGYWFDQTGTVTHIQPDAKYPAYVDLNKGGQVAFHEHELILADVAEDAAEAVEPLADWELELLSGRRSVILRTAEKLINGQRAKDYGDACENFQRIADLWAPILRTPVTAEQVALCMAQVKIARLITSPGHEDSWIDLAGYAALGGEIASDGA